MGLIELSERLDYLTENQNFWLQGVSSAASGLDGRQQVVFTENRVWTGSIDFVPMLGQDLMEVRSIGTRLRGRANRLRVPFDNRGTIRAMGTDQDFWRELGFGEADIDRGSTPFSDSTLFSDGTGFALPDPSDPVLGADAVAGVSVIKTAGFMGRHISVGARFSIEDFLYEVASNDEGVIAFEPPLRISSVAGTQVRVSRPMVQVRLAADDGWRQFVQHARLSQPMTVEFVEAFDR